jgi:hypothetical protein
MKLKAEARAQGGCGVSEKKKKRIMKWKCCGRRS